MDELNDAAIITYLLIGRGCLIITYHLARTVMLLLNLDCAT